MILTELTAILGPKLLLLMATQICASDGICPECHMTSQGDQKLCQRDCDKARPGFEAVIAITLL
jgi:hypothetical protein